jgi:hypothetical protein
MPASVTHIGAQGRYPIPAWHAHRAREGAEIRAAAWPLVPGPGYRGPETAPFALAPRHHERNIPGRPPLVLVNDYAAVSAPGKPDSIRCERNHVGQEGI